jgi:hypothetical protein
MKASYQSESVRACSASHTDHTSSTYSRALSARDTGSGPAAM